MSRKYVPSEKAINLMQQAIKKFGYKPGHLAEELEKIKKADISPHIFAPTTHISRGRYKE